MRIIERLLDKDVSAGIAGIMVMATIGLFGAAFTGIWLLMPYVYD